MELGVIADGERVRLGTLPFAAGDITAGTESELQAVVIGGRGGVDLPRQIEDSSYYANVCRRIASGDTPRRAMKALEGYLNHNRDNVWENSWVRFPERLLSPFARRTLWLDLSADKSGEKSGLRGDTGRFMFRENGEAMIRIPVSYLLKLALAEAIGAQDNPPGQIFAVGSRLMGHFLNDNTSPETYSFHVVALSGGSGAGMGVAREKSLRFLLSQLLLMYANRRFELLDRGQQAMVYFAPHPPVRQKLLNDCISDEFYRELFMSPCLSGWDDGEAKHAYMKLCHEVLSRSQLNAIAKLREAGIIVNNLVVLPNSSNISLANNGTHVSLGSRRLTAAMGAGGDGFGAAGEKLVGDLAIKIVEHFLPLFVGTYSAAPYRLDFADFHPEKVLGFLPHELDYTHLRMLWRRWRRKADLSVFGFTVTPYGPEWLDRRLSSIFSLKGDFIPDFRLIDYLVALMSTERSPALDGRVGSGERLKRDLASMGVFDERMSLYTLYRLREFSKMGFSGFEGRYYSLFESLAGDLSKAVELQALLTALAYKYLAAGMVTHSMIPDEPFIESERRQIFFGTAIGIPTFYVRQDSGNAFLAAILKRTKRSRGSRRYSGYLRVRIEDYRQALLQTLIEDGSDLIEMMGMEETVADLRERLRDPGNRSASGRLIGGILREAGAGNPMKMKAEEFNLTAERYYRGTLRFGYLAEALGFLVESLEKIEHDDSAAGFEIRRSLDQYLGGRDASRTAATLGRSMMAEEASEQELLMLINLTLLSIDREMAHGREEALIVTTEDEQLQARVAASIY